MNEDKTATFFYTISTDLVSFLFMLSSFLRFFVYFFCNREIRGGGGSDVDVLLPTQLVLLLPSQTSHSDYLRKMQPH